MQWLSSIGRAVLAFFAGVTGVLLHLLGSLLIVTWALWCLATIAMICAALSTWLIEGYRPVGDMGGLHPWLFTLLGEIGAVCRSLARRLLAWEDRLWRVPPRRLPRQAPRRRAAALDFPVLERGHAGASRY